MNTRIIVTAALAALAVTSTVMSSAQTYRQDFPREIRIIVNGDQVDFSSIGPREINGRLLVPLRGVLEKLGAYVDWDAGTQTVLANREGTRIEIPIGSNFAIVNGERVRLDVAATTIGGATMVPLRFLSETLGASVSWNGQTNTAMIFSEGGPGVEFRRAYRRRAYEPEPAPGKFDPKMPVVESVETNFAGGMVFGGDVIRVTMRATPGGKAYFRIRGVVGEQTMREVSPGVYKGSWRAPMDERVRVDTADILAFVVVGDRATAEKTP